MTPTLKNLRESEFRSAYLEAALFSGEPLQKISELLEIPEEVVSEYQATYLPVSNGTKLERLEWIENEMEDSRTRRKATMKLWAMSSGLEFIRWRLGESTNTPPVAGMQQLFSICFYKAKEAMFSPSTSDEGKESQKWVKLSTDIARLIKLWVTDSDAARKDLDIALREINPEFESIDSLL